MSVSLSPSSQLGFQRPLTSLVKRTLAVSNHNSQAIAYKVKTTAPKQYCVRPNSGRIEPGETVEVQVLLQPMKEDPPSGTKCKDKFLVQSVVITTERENIPLAELWGVVEKDKDSQTGELQIHEQKIRCTYLPAADDSANSSIPEEDHSQTAATSQGADTSIANHPADSSFVSTINSTSPPSASTVSTSSPSGLPHLGQPTTSQPRAVVANASSPSSSPSSSSSLPTSTTVDPTPASSSNISNSTPTPSTFVDTAREKAQSAGVMAGGAIATAAVTAAAGFSNVAHSIDPNAQMSELERVKLELKESRQEIERLKAQLNNTESSGLRQRQVGSSSTTAADKSNMGPGGSSKVVEMQGAEGVPVQTVAAIAFSVFMFTWLFL